MKKIKSYIIILSGIILLAGTGCQDILDTRFDTSRTQGSLLSDRNTLFSFANQFYVNLPNGFTAIDNNLFATATDEAQQSSNSFNAKVFNDGILSAYNNPLSGLYKKYYDGIRAANFFLDYSVDYRHFLAMNRDTIADSTKYKQDIQNIKWYRAEAHIARAFYYSLLAKLYSNVPIINYSYQNSNAIAPQEPFDSVLNYIVSEIDTYKGDLQVNWKTSQFATQDGRFSLGSALALKADILLFGASPLHNPDNLPQKWQRAADAANALLTTQGLNLSLAPNYGTYFTGSNPLTSAETIFAVRSTASNNLEKQNYPIATPGGNTGICPTQNLVSSYEYIGPPDPTNPYANRDPRLAASIVTNGSTWNSRTIDESPSGSDDMSKTQASITGYYLKKFLTDNLNLVQGGTAQHQWIIYRYAEILLDYAEALNELYGPDFAPAGYSLTARQALKMVRDRASTLLPTVTATSIPDFRNAIKHERLVEFAFEDKRYWDLLRWKDAENVLNQPVQGVTVVKNGTTYVYSVVNVAQRKFIAPTNYYFPFTYNDIVISKGSLVQNPGY